MSQKLVAKRSKLKPFLKIVNYSHVMPTRYSLDSEIDASLKAAVNKADIKEPTKKRAARNKVKAIFEGRYTQGQNPWFFSKLRF